MQLLLALPFLLSNPWAYVARALNFGRTFDQVCVNSLSTTQLHTSHKGRSPMRWIVYILAVLQALPAWRVKASRNACVGKLLRSGRVHRLLGGSHEPRDHMRPP